MKRPLNRSLCDHWLAHLTAAGLAGVAFLAGGCASTSETKPQPRSQRGGVDEMTLDETAQYAEDRYLVGPRASDKFGYRLDWQRSPGTGSIRHLDLAGDSVFTLDRNNFLSRTRASDGVRIWRVPILQAIEEVYGVAFVPSRDRVYAISGAALIELDAATGNQLSKQELAKVAATPPTVFGPFALYGARNGELVWHSFDAQYMWKSYQMAPSIIVRPVLDDTNTYVVCAGTDGRLMVLRAADASQMWNTQLLDEIVDEPVAVNGAVFVSSLDQHVRAYDLETGRRLWSKLTEGKLDSSPVYIADRIYQEVPGVGLLCMEALPFDAPGGVEIWRCSGVAGHVITQRNNDLLVWDEDSRRLTIVDGTHGAVMRTVELPKVARLYASAIVEGVLYAVSDGGVVQRLVPRG